MIRVVGFGHGLTLSPKPPHPQTLNPLNRAISVAWSLSPEPLGGYGGLSEHSLKPKDESLNPKLKLLDSLL